MKQYGYCRAVPGLPGIGEQASALMRTGVEIQDIFVDYKDSDLACCPEFSKLKASLTRQDTVVVCGLWSLGRPAGKLPRNGILSPSRSSATLMFWTATRSPPHTAGGLIRPSLSGSALRLSPNWSIWTVGEAVRAVPPSRGRGSSARSTGWFGKAGLPTGRPCAALG